MSESLSVRDLDDMCIESVRIFAERLRKLLDERGITRVAFAQTTGMNVSSIHKYLRGDAMHIPSIAVVVRCSIVLGVSPDYLLGFCDDDDFIAAACSNSKCGEGSVTKIYDVSSLRHCDTLAA